jgi:hypothetical protein
MSTEEPPAKRGPGRPPSNDPRTEFLTIRLTKTELASIQATAKAAGAKPADWSRAKILAAEKRARPKTTETRVVTETEVIALTDGAGNIRHRVVQPGDIITHTQEETD